MSFFMTVELRVVIFDEMHICSIQKEAAVIQILFHNLDIY